ncbi:hypothetical protein J2Z22_002967 [Paenibacillus forsythiae]|uniref:Holin-like toxin n=1 Tax=Paenibacillus forsythiae TaxID=365616 RepID=A0ABU3H999_9BACL|nr:hypothetical protein [Paenibacillus forsythiae]
MSMPQDLPPEQVRRAGNIAVMTVLGLLIAITFIIRKLVG